MVGLQVRGEDTTFPIFHLQYNYIIKQLEERKYNWILKATGIGVSESEAFGV